MFYANSEFSSVILNPRCLAYAQRNYLGNIQASYANISLLAIINSWKPN